MYLVWFDDNAKRSLSDKIAAARAAYAARFGTPATVVRVSPDADVSGVRPAGYQLVSGGALVVPRGSVYVGRE